MRAVYILWVIIASTAYAGLLLNSFVNVATSTFVPTDISGMQIWFDSTSPSNYTLTSGKVSTWADTSGNGRDATQGTAGQRPTITAAQINGKDVMTFVTANSTELDFSNTVALTPAGSSWTMFWAAQLTTNSGFKGLMRTYDGSASQVLCWGYATDAGYADFYFGRDNAGTAFSGLKPILTTGTQTGVHFFIVEWNGSAFSVYNESGAMTPGSGSSRGCDTSTKNAIGNDTNGAFAGYIMHIGSYNSALGSTDRGNLSTWLKGQTGL